MEKRTDPQGAALGLEAAEGRQQDPLWDPRGHRRPQSFAQSSVLRETFN